MAREYLCAEDEKRPPHDLRIERTMAAGAFESDMASAFETEGQPASSSRREVDLGAAPGPMKIGSPTAGAALEDDEASAGENRRLPEPPSWQNTWEYWGPYWCCRTRKQDRKDSSYGSQGQSTPIYITRSGDASGITNFNKPKAQV